MANEFYLKQGDTSPVLDFRIAGAPDLTGAGCVFHMMLPMGTEKLSSPGLIMAPDTLRFAWRAQDTEKIGVFQAEFVVTYSDGRKETFPNEGFIKVIINQGALVT